MDFGHGKLKRATIFTKSDKSSKGSHVKKYFNGWSAGIKEGKLLKKINYNYLLFFK